MEYLSIIFAFTTLFLLGITSFLTLQQKKQADQSLRPLQERLMELDQQLRSMERYRTIDATKVGEELKKMQLTDQVILKETQTLLQALRKPDVRGFWGEVQLKRLLEVSGMLPYTDFVEQGVVDTDEGRLRPDIIVRLPQKKHIVIDAKAPMEAYLEAVASETLEGKQEKMMQHVRRIKEHIDQLKKKRYAKSVDGFEFVLLFLPTEALFSAALEMDPTLLEYGIRQDVILVTPTSLVALLKTVALSWKEDRLRENLERVRELGQELHKRILDASVHVHAMSKALNQTIEAHNKFIGSLERRVLVTARKFEEFGAAGQDQEIRVLEELNLLAKEPAELE